MSVRDEPWLEEWPKNGLETIGRCPACGDRSRSLAYDSLIDNSFRTAKGKWRMWRCDACGSGYLDPRPSAATIGSAYASYYTHAEVASRTAYRDLGLVRKLRRAFVNGYTRHRFGSRERPAIPLVGRLLGFSKSQRLRLEREYRHLGPRPEGAGRLLDIGCGSGSFVALAEACGWNAEGVDPDPDAAARAARRGLKVRTGDAFSLGYTDDSFDRITLCHVIEHVPDPARLVRRISELLAPNGRLWIETPNFTAPTHHQFGARWRGLEAPRHLCILTAHALEQMCLQAGLEILRSPETLNGPDLAAWSARLDSIGSEQPLVALGGGGDDAEMLLMVARKPS